jgi:uncharacterized protein with von Willebrand factor type A (vWA) domain
MPLSAVDSAALDIDAGFASSFPDLIGASAAVRQYVDGQIGAWKSETETVLGAAFPLAQHERTLENWRMRLHASSPTAETLEAVHDYAGFCKLAGYPANAPFWRDQFAGKTPRTAIAQKLAGDRSIGIRLLLSEWQQRMDQARAAWALAEIARRRASFMEQLEKILAMLQRLQERLAALGLDVGLLLDLSAGSLAPQDIRQIERWASYLAQDEGVSALCDMLGKMRQIALSERLARVKSFAPARVEVPDVHSREEIIGIRLGRDIEHALPSELALLADPDTALLFDLKYVESRLMCFDMQGIQAIGRPVETEEERAVSEADEPGPMVICIDTSGSMSGTPETVAKAVAFFLAQKAREQGRACYLINFSTSVTTLELSGGVGMDALLGFLRLSFHGGTDVAPAFEHALDKMEEDAYERADLLLVSDFIMAALPERLQARIERQRGSGNRFHSLVVGDAYMTRRLTSLFDNEWIFDPCHGHIHDLVRFERRLVGPASAVQPALPVPA